MDIPIINNSSKLPYGAIWHIRRSLSWINPVDLVGIGHIQLLDNIVEPSQDSPEWHKRAVSEEINVNGEYIRQHQTSPAYIILYIRDLYRGISPFYWWTPVTTLNICRTLSHEVGHHLIAQRGYVFQPGEKVTPAEFEEEMANRYSATVLQKMKKNWYYKLGQWAIKDLASKHFILGVLDWKEKKYKEAAERWYRAFHLDPERADALHWYLRAKEIIKTQKQNHQM